MDFNLNVTDKKHVAGKVQAITEQLLHEGLDVAQVLAQADLTPQQLADPETRISQHQIFQICQYLLAQPISSMFAFDAGRRMHVTDLGMFGYAAMNQPTMRATFEFALRYRPLSAPMIGLQLVNQGDACLLRFTPMFGISEQSAIYDFILQFNIGMFSNLCKDALGVHFRLEELLLKQPRSEQGQIMAAAFDTLVVFDQPDNAMCMSNSLLDAPLTLANPTSASIAERMCDDLMSSFQEERLLIRAVSDELMKSGREFPTLYEISARLSINERTLRRRLVSAGTSYSQLKNSIRRELAEQYLAETAMTIDDIAFLTGFSEVSAFRAAFKRWSGKTPAQYRRQFRI